MRHAHAVSMAGTFRPDHPAMAVIYDLGLVMAGSLFIAASAQISVHLAFTPVPITAQTFAVLLVGALLGSTRGAAAVSAYLLEGAAGLPVFAGGAAGPGVFMMPSAGYLYGFVVGAFVVGRLAERGWDRRPWLAAVAFATGETIILCCGALWLANFSSAWNAVTHGVAPFLPGAVVKIGLATAMLPLGWKALATIEQRWRSGDRVER